MAATQPPSDAAHDKSVDDVLNAMAAVRAGPNAKDRKPVGLEEFQAVLDSTPLFMKETPEESGEENYVLDALKSLVFEGEGDGEFRYTSIADKRRGSHWLQDARQRAVRPALVPRCH